MDRCLIFLGKVLLHLASSFSISGQLSAFILDILISPESLVSSESDELAFKSLSLMLHHFQTSSCHHVSKLKLSNVVLFL